MTPKETRKLRKKLDKFKPERLIERALRGDIIFQATVRHIGKQSYALTIPADTVKLYDIKLGNTFNVILQGMHERRKS